LLLQFIKTYEDSL